jgi:hypothetical protein
LVKKTKKLEPTSQKKHKKIGGALFLFCRLKIIISIVSLLFSLKVTFQEKRKKNPNTIGLK